MLFYNLIIIFIFLFCHNQCKIFNYIKIHKVFKKILFVYFPFNSLLMANNYLKN